MMGDIHEYNKKDLLMKSLAVEVTNDLKSILRKKRVATLVVPGGTTPKPFFKQLSQSDLDWARVTIIPSDDRFVPEKNVLSNSGLIRTYLLQNFASQANFISFFKSDYSLEDLTNVISEELKTILPIDVAVLGMGVDMHTASIFPDADKLNDALDLMSPNVLISVNSPSAAESRLTLTAKTLRDSYKVHLLITGSEKKAALEFALKSKDNWEIAPVRSVLSKDGIVKIHYSH